MTQLENGYQLDGFVVDECIHAGGMAEIYRVHCADPARQPDFPLILKLPFMAAGDGAETCSVSKSRSRFSPRCTVRMHRVTSPPAT